MRSLKLAVMSAFLVSLVVGCGGVDQPNAPATAEEVSSPDFSKNTLDMMKKANSGMSVKKKGATKN